METREGEQPSSGEQETGRQPDQSQDQQDTGRPLTVEDLIKRRQDLEKSIASREEEKEKDIANKLTEREVMIKEYKLIVPLFEKAEETLRYFEEQNKLGNIKGEKEIEELERTKENVNKVREQREAALQKYEDIMKIKDVSEKVEEEAHEEEISREAREEIERKIKELCDAIVEYATQREAAFKEIQESRNAFISSSQELQRIIGDAMRSLDYKHDETRDFLNRVSKNISHGTGRLVENVNDIKERRRGLGFLKFKEKSALDSVLGESSKFTELDEFKRRVNEAERSLKEIEGRTAVFGEQFRTLADEARKLFKNPFHVFSQVKESLMKSGENRREFEYIFREIINRLGSNS